MLQQQEVPKTPISHHVLFYLVLQVVFSRADAEMEFGVNGVGLSHKI